MSNQSAAVIAGVMPDSYEAGRVYCRSAKFTAPAELAADSVIEMVPIPKNAMILDIKFQTSAAFHSATTTMDIGDGDDVDRFFDGVDVNAGACNGELWSEGDVATCFNHVYSADDTIDAKVLGEVMDADVEITMDVYYKVLGSIKDEADAF